nr:S8 family serine peptidase [uncultured Ruminococcus sp.]
MIKIKKLISLTLATTMIAGTVLSTHYMANETEEKSGTTDYIVVTNSGRALDEANKISNESEELLKINSKKTISKMTLGNNDLSQLKSIDGVTNVEKDIVLSGSSNDNANSTEETDVLDYLFKDVNTKDLNQWNLESLGVDEIDTSPSGEKVKVELLDSGVSWSDDIDVKYRENLIEEDAGINPLYEDYSQHGTGMAGVICAKDNGKGVTGVNPNVDLYSVRALDNNIEAPLSRIIQGIYWGIDNHMDIINMSFGTNTNSASLRTAIKTAYDNGIVLVSASGNDKEKGVQYPSAYPEVISVGSQSPNGEISDFTSVDENLDVVAPGENIESTGIFGTINGSDGTSIATAQVTGIASLILEKDKSKSPDFVKDLILKSSKKITDNGIVTGAVDGEYALSIYDDFAKNYSPSKSVTEYSNPSDVEEYTTDGYVKGLWFKDEHKAMAEQGGNDLGITGNSLKLIISGSTAPDEKSLSYIKSSKKISFKEISAFHGGGNYVANLKCAWKFVCLLKKYKNSKTLTQIGKETKKYANSLPCYSSKISKDTIDDMIDSLAIIDTVNFNTTLSNDNEKISNNQALYKAIGMCFHMIGDTFSHRTQVPTVYSKDKFEKKYSEYTVTVKGESKIIDLFDNATNFALDTNLKGKIIDACQTNNVNKNYRHRQHLKTAVSYGVAEFRDIKKFSKYYYIDKAKDQSTDKPYINKICTIYEDNPNFYSRRNGEAYTACGQLGLDKFYELNLGVLIPTEENGTSVKLWDFKNLSHRAGYDTSLYSDNVWKVCTSFPKEVDSNGNIVNK